MSEFITDPFLAYSIFCILSIPVWYFSHELESNDIDPLSVYIAIFLVCSFTKLFLFIGGILLVFFIPVLIGVGIRWCVNKYHKFKNCGRIW